MGTTNGRGSFKTTLSVVLAVCIVTNVWYRGPFFGLLVYTLFTAPPALLLAWLLRYARVPQNVLLPVAALAAVFVSWALCAPPTTAQIFQRHLGCSLPDDIREVKRWNDCWGIDPGYYIRFRASNRSVEGIIAKTPLTRDDPAPPAAAGVFCFPWRGWWKPGDIQNPRVWRGRGQVGDWHVELWHDQDSGLVYLRVYTM